MAQDAPERNVLIDSLDSPWLHRQVDQHLLSGFVARRWPGILALFHLGPGDDFARRASLWITLKVSGFIISSIMLLCSPIVFLKQDPDAPAVLLLGLTWLPGLEFLPRLASRQKILSVLRGLLTLWIWAVWIR